MAGTVVASTINNDTGLFATNNAYLGIAKAWVNWDGSTSSGNTVRASFNVSSITRTATGNYTISFTTAMTDANYCFAGSGQNDAINTNVVTSSTVARTTTNLYIVVALPNNSTGNPLTVNVIVHGN